MKLFLLGSFLGFLGVAITWSAIEFGQVVWIGEGLFRLLSLGIPFMAITALVTFFLRAPLTQSISVPARISTLLSGLVFGVVGYLIEVASFVGAVAVGKEAGLGDWYWPVGVTVGAMAIALTLCAVLAGALDRVLRLVSRR